MHFEVTIRDGVQKQKLFKFSLLPTSAMLDFKVLMNC